jgi:hypothetical protein
MNKHLPSLLIALFFASGFLQALSAETNAVKVKASIDTVVVYSGLAQVERKASVQLKKGIQTLVFEHLPPGLDPDNLNVRVSSGRILDVRAERVYLLEARRQDVRELEAELDRLLGEDRSLEDRQAVLRSSLDLLGSLDHLNAEKVESDARFAKVSVEDWQKVVDYAEKARLSKLSELRELSVKRLELAERISVLRKKIDDLAGPEYLQLRNAFVQGVESRAKSQYGGQVPPAFRDAEAYFSQPRGPSEYRVLCQVESAEDRTCRVELVTTEPSVSWTPLYDVRAFPAKEKVEISYQAMVRQQTGADWENVNLVLSTARPTAGMVPPAIGPWLLDVYRPVTGTLKRKSMQPMAAPSAMRAESVMESDEESYVAAEEPPPPVSERRSASVVFPVRAKSTVPSSIEGQKVTIDSFSVASRALKFEHYAAPEAGDKVFFSVNLTNRQAYPWLSGRANVFIDNDLAGAFGLPDVRENAEFRLFLGRDESVTAKKELVKKFTDTKGNSVEVSYFYRITLKNLKDRPVTLVLKDTLPVSRSDDVKVKIDSVEPAAVDTADEQATTDWQNGIRRWTFDLAPGQERVVEEKYSVRYSADKPAWPLR